MPRLTLSYIRLMKSSFDTATGPSSLWVELVDLVTAAVSKGLWPPTMKTCDQLMSQRRCNDLVTSPKRRQSHLRHAWNREKNLGSCPFRLEVYIIIIQAVPNVPDILQEYTNNIYFKATNVTIWNNDLVPLRLYVMYTDVQWDHCSV